MVKRIVTILILISFTNVFFASHRFILTIKPESTSAAKSLTTMSGKSPTLKTLKIKEAKHLFHSDKVNGSIEDLDNLVNRLIKKKSAKMMTLSSKKNRFPNRNKRKPKNFKAPDMRKYIVVEIEKINGLNTEDIKSELSKLDYVEEVLVDKKIKWIQEIDDPYYDSYGRYEPETWVTL